jgi:long-chain acyl-CoA synthetase
MGTITSGERRMSTDEVAYRITQVAAGLEDLGLRAGDGVAICLRNDIAFVEATMAAGALGCFPVQINWHYTIEEVRYILEDSGAKVLVVHADLLRDLRGAVPAGVQILSVATPPEIQAAYRIPARAAVVESSDVDWNRWLAQFSVREAPPAGLPATIVYTSGTTGKPKGVRRQPFTPEQLDVISAMFARSYGFHLVSDPTQVVTAIVGPAYHTAPNYHATFCFRAGASIVITAKFDPEELLRTIERERITHLNMVPIMFSRMLKLPADVRSRYDLSSLCFVAHAAAPCPPEIKRAMIDWWGPVIYEYYGSTEMGNITFCTSEEWLAHPGTVGRVMPGAELRILDDDGIQLPPGRVGEIVGRYHGAPDFTYNNDEEKRRAADRGGLIAPGDVGYVDEDGYLFICDRKVDMVISGGVNIYPAEIEALLHEMPAVADCAVFGIPDEEFGEAVCAIVQPRPGHEELTADEVQAFLRARAAAYKIPRQVAFTAELPREDSGKIFKRKLREPYWAGAGRTI